MTFPQAILKRYIGQTFNRLKTTEQIIKELSGGDETKGSCASLSFAYVGNKGGYNVLDFRGGKIIRLLFGKTKYENFIKLKRSHGNQVCNILRIKLGFMSAFNIMDLSDDLLFVFCL